MAISIATPTAKFEKWLVSRFSFLVRCPAGRMRISCDVIGFL